jgi:hypothetical protein
MESESPHATITRFSRVRAPRRRLPWLALLAAATTVATAVILSGPAAAAASFGTGQAGASGQRAPAGAFTGVPPYYVLISDTSATVRATATGAVLATVPTSTPFAGVTGAADDRTFVLDAQRQVMGPRVLWPDQPAFYLLRLTASGGEASYRRLAIPALPKGMAVTGLALSPDGSKLAIAMDTGIDVPRELMEISIYTLATGTVHTWTAAGSNDSEAPGGFTGSGTDGSESISWTANAKTLAIDWGQGQSLIGVRLLDTTAGGNNLIADSRLAVVLGPGNPARSLIMGKDHVSQCVTDDIITSDGSSIICGYATTIVTSPTNSQTTTGFIRYSTSTGKITGVLGVYQFTGQAAGDIALYWTSSTGNTLIGSDLRPSGVSEGVINGEKFTPLPGPGGPGVAW